MLPKPILHMCDILRTNYVIQHMVAVQEVLLQTNSVQKVHKHDSLHLKIYEMLLHPTPTMWCNNLKSSVVYGFMFYDFTPDLLQFPQEKVE
jgi:hypothetical protein